MAPTKVGSRHLLKTTQYAKDVIRGRIVTGELVRLACERHLSDLERSKDDSYPYRFDIAKAYRVIEFIESYCAPSMGEHTRIKLAPWDHFVLGSLFGWVCKSDGMRRFRSGLVWVARKNGKSLKASGTALFGASKYPADWERGARVYMLANSMKQSRATIYDECRQMVRMNSRLQQSFRDTRDAIFYDETASKIEPMASDADTLDGLNCYLGEFDEIHEYKTYKLINVIKNSTASRRQPLLLYITTAGYVLDGPLMDMVERGTDILNGVISDERAFYYLATLDKDDDVNDPSCWVKANPNLGISVRLEDMVEEWEQRKSVPAERADFITKRLNVFVCSDDMPFVTFEILKRNSRRYELGDLDGRPCVGGYDLSNNEDLTAAALEFPLPESKLFVLHHSWVPQAKVDADNEKVPYRVWEDAGWLTIVPGEFVDHTYVYDWFTENARRYQVLMVTYDPANAYRLNNDLEQWGGAEWTKVTRQGALTLSPALKDIKTQLISGNVISNDDPMLRWYTNNVKLVIADRNGNWLPTKQQGYRKIDGFAAWLNAHTQTMLLPPVGDPNASPVGFISRRDLRG